MTRRRLVARVGLAAGLGAGALLLFATHQDPAAATAAACVNQAAPHHATVVVRHGDGREMSACVGFSGGAISGKDLLTASGIDHGFSPDATFGDTVCRLDFEPMTYPPDCLKPPNDWWSIWTADCGGQWSFAHRGIDALGFADHQAEGFSYIPQAGGPGPSPPGDRCPPAAPAAASGGGGPATPASGAPGGTAAAQTQRPSGTAAVAGSSPAGDGATAPPSADPADASANPGEVALGGGTSAKPVGGSGTPLVATAGSGLLGLGAAALVAIGLVAVLVAQLVLPRLRR